MIAPLHSEITHSEITDEIDPVFLKLKIADRDELSGWLMRAYFDQEKHSNCSYFNKNVTKENVLQFVSNKKNNFPQTPLSIANIWKTIKKLRKELETLPLDLKQEEAGIYTKGEKTLAVIGKAIGNITPTMVNKISDAAIVKLNTILNALNSDNSWLAKETEEKIENAILSSAEKLTDILFKEKTPANIIKHLVEQKIITENEALSIDQIEIDAIKELLSWIEEGATQSEIEDVFIADINKLINVFNIMQIMVSREMFPPAKKGRPKLNGK